MPIFREVMAMSAFVNLLALAVPVFTLQVYDRVIGSASISTLRGFIIGMVMVVVFDYVLRMARSRVLQTVALRVDVMVGRRLFEKVMALPLQTLESYDGAHWTGLFRDVDTVRNTLSGASAVLVADLPFAVFFLGLIFVIATPIAWVLLIIVPVFMFVAWRSGKVMSGANKEERKTSSSRDAMIAEMIAGRTTIKALALDGAMRPIWEEKHADNIERSIVRGSKADSYTNLGASLTMTTTICMTTIGALAIIDGTMTIGALIATNMLSGRLLGPLNQLVGQWRVFTGFMQATERLGAVFTAPSERQESAVTLGRPNGEITLENVTFSYTEEGSPVVNGVQLVIKAGGLHALVGRNGSGKTTLLKLTQGLYKPNFGRVLIDGADISQFTRTELAGWFGYVPQECVLFAGTVRDNIVHRIPDATDDEVLKAATESGVHKFIIDMPDGYATEIGEAGSRLSGGQRQRIAIARALIGDPPVLLLDEPSSSLDRQAEQELRQTLVEIGRDRTVILVTHSPILLAACNNLVALDKGKVALAGPAKEILPRLFGAKPKSAGPRMPQEGRRPPRPAPPPSRGPAQPEAAATPLAKPAIQVLDLEEPKPGAQPEIRTTTPAKPQPRPEAPAQPAIDAPAAANPQPQPNAQAPTVRRIPVASAPQPRPRPQPQTPPPPAARPAAKAKPPARPRATAKLKVRRPIPKPEPGPGRQS